MTGRTAALLFGAAAATGAAAIGAGTAVLFGTRSADRVDRAYTALTEMAFTMPPLDSDDSQRPELVLGQGRPAQLTARPEGSPARC